MSNTVAQLSSDTKIAISLKKLQGKAHTKTENELYNEGLPSGITMDSSTVFGSTPPTNPTTTLGAITGGVVEKVRLTCTFIAGSDTPSGRHGYKLSLPSNYESTSSNSKKGTAPFTNGAELVSSNGLLQLVPPSFDYRYEAVPYYGPSNNLSSIPLADPRDWNLDYFNGVYFQQDPPVDTAENPTFIDAFLYIGDFLDTVVSNAGGTTTFTSLTDTPANYSSSAGKFVKVNNGGNGLEFDTITLPSNFVGDDGDNSVNDEAAGLVPAPQHGDAAAGKYLKADGTWSTPPDTNSTYTSSDFDHDQLQNFVANEHIDWTQASAGTIHATNYTNSTYSNFVGDDGDNSVNDEAAGLVPAPAHGDAAAGKYLKADGTWSTPPDTNTTYSVFVGDDGNSNVNNEATGLVPAPSHGDAASGKFLKADGTWAVPAGGGGGGGGGSAATGVDKYTVRVSSQTNALTAVPFSGLNTGNVPTNASLSVYLNGDLLLSGSTANVTAFSNQDPRLPSTTNAHYYVSSTTELTFGFALVPGDYLLVEKLSFGTSPVTQVNAVNGLKQNSNTGNITIEPNYDGATESIIKKAYDGTSITVDSENDFLILHDVTDNKVKYIKANQVGSGQAGIIGNAEDGDYTDGLFSDFDPNTPTGTAIDKINEVLKLLAPGPAPDVRSINATTSNGISAKLSFGSSNTGGSAYIDSSNAAGMTPIDTNGTYSAATQGTSRRLGIYTTATTIQGIVNHDVARDQYANSVINYVADSFGNGELGTLKLFVNNMSSPVHSVDLSNFTGAGNPGSGSGSSFTSNSGFYDLSTTKDATSEGGTAFDIFKHRTAKYRIHSNHQREGWNYARVVHTVGSSDKTTNYIEWINDTDTTTISAASTSITNIVGSDTFVLSGIKYFKTSSYDYSTTISNAHRALHTGTPIDFNTTYGSITTATDQNSVHLLNTFPSVESGEDYTKTIAVTAAGTFNVNSSGFPAGGLLNGSNTVSVDVVHPNTSKNQSGLASSVMSGLLMWFPTSTSTDLFEDFNSEAWRMQSGAYNAQADVYTSSAFVTPWSSTQHVNGSDAGHNTGLVQYQGQLRAPRNTLLNGNFASVTNGPGSNANYSTITSGTREYIRAFKKTDAGTVRDIRLTLNGSASIIANNTAFPNNANAIKVFVKLPGTTGWTDLYGAFSLGSNADNDGSHVGTFTSSISGAVHNYASFGIDTVAQNEYVLVKILADATWTGNLSSMTVRFGASSGNESSVPDNCSSINSTSSNGIDAKLSFGAASSIPNSDANHPYANVAGSNSLASVNVNSIYSSGSNRKGIYDGAAILSGIVNSEEAGDSGNFVQYAIRYGNEGTIKLFVNDVEKHTVNLASFTGTGNPGSGVALNVNAAGSGFSNISTAQYVTWSDGIPDFRYNVRTMHWRVVAADQRAGHNWVRVVHTVGSNDYTTNYMEWVNDPNGDSVTFSNVELADFTDTNTSHLSGIEYFNSPHSTFKYRVANMHRNVYSKENDAIGFIGPTNVSITNLRIVGAGLSAATNVNALRTSVPAIDTSSDTNYTLPMDVTGSLDYTPTKTLPGSYGTSANNVTISSKAYHPISNTSGASQSASKNNFLVWSPQQSNSSNQQSIEDFSGESYRLQDATYSITADITGSSNDWNSQTSVIGSSAGHNTGLVIYNGNLIVPSAAGNSGNFSTGLQGPSGNVDYSLSNVTNNTRTYLRAFYNPNAGDSASNIQLRLTGTASLVSDGGPSNSGTLGSNTNIHIKVKLVYHNAESTKTTGWLDAGEQATGGNTDGSGCSGQPLSGLNVVWNNNTQTVQINHPTGRGLYGTSSPFNRNYVIIKIETHKQWTGKFTDMRITAYN